MTSEQVVRRLAAIVAADVVGYSRLIGADETGTLARLATLRHDITPSPGMPAACSRKPAMAF